MTANVGIARPFGAVYGVLLRHIISRGRIAGLATLAGLLILLGWAVGRSDGVTTERAVNVIGNLGLAVLLPVGALIFASAVLSDLREDRTLVYLWLRPMPAWIVPTAAMAASVTALAPLAISAGVVTSLLLDTGSSLVTASIVAMAAGSIAYCAVFVTFGLFVKRTLLWGLVYILIWEGFVASGGQGAARFAIRAYTRSIMARMTDVDINLAGFSLVTSIVVCAGVAVGAAGLCVWRYRKIDVD